MMPYLVVLICQYVYSVLIYSFYETVSTHILISKLPV